MSPPKNSGLLSFGTWAFALLAAACGGGVERGSCTVDNVTYQDGKGVPSGDCNTCTCDDGAVMCTEKDCTGDICSLPLKNDGGCEAAIERFWFNPETGVCEEFTYGGCGGNENNFESREECEAACARQACTVDGIEYQDGEAVPSGDCNTCACDDGSVQCTLIHCGPVVNVCTLPLANDGPCDAALQRYFHNTESGECEEFTYGGCGGNENNFESLQECEATCGDDPMGISCQVGEEVYADGASNVPDPMSCNTCSCDSGEVTGCTEIDCPKECPDGSAFGRDCTECGPTDACRVQRSGCLPECESQDDCLDSGGVCLDGLCKNVCG